MSVPQTWKRTRIDRVATVNARIGWKALTATEYQSEGYVFLATPNIKSSAIDFDRVNYISEYRYQESPELKLQLGDVLLAKDGNTLGITNIVRELPRPATVNGSIAVLRPFDIEPRFLRYVLASSSTQDVIDAIKGRSTFPPSLSSAASPTFSMPRRPGSITSPYCKARLEPLSLHGQWHSSTSRSMSLLRLMARCHSVE